MTTSDDQTLLTLTPGIGSGPILRLDAPLSFWGGVDPSTGIIIDAHHPQAGIRITDAIVVLESVRGSNAGGTVLMECIRAGTAPAGIVLRYPTQILAVGPIVAGEIYGRALPIVVTTNLTADVLRAGNRVRIEAESVHARITLQA